MGGSIAKSLAKEKSIVIVLGRNEALLKSLTLELNVFSESNYFVVDVLSKEALIKVKEKIIQKWGRVDALINAVGGNLPGAVVGEDQSLFDLAEDDFDEVVDLNLKGTLLPSLVFGEVMKDQGKGSIVNYSSMAVDRTITRVAGYSASKAAMENFTRWMAVEMALRYGDGVRVNAIAPGFFIGKQNKKLLLNEDGSLTELGEKIIRNTPMKRFGKAEELSGAIHFLCSDSARFITGIVLPVDGGFSAYSGV